MYCFSFPGYPNASCEGETGRCWLERCGILPRPECLLLPDLEQYKEVVGQEGRDDSYA